MTRKTEKRVMLMTMSVLLLVGILTTPKIVLSRVDAPNSFLTRGNCSEDSAGVVIPPQSGSSPLSNGWILLATDPDEGAGTSLKTIYGQLQSGIIYFKVEHWRPWTTIADINTAIFMDADQNPSTGLPDGHYSGQNTGIGADYAIIVGWEATEMLKWDTVTGWWDTANPISLAYLEAPEGSSVFIVGVYRADAQSVGPLDGAVSDTVSSWDWMPDSGHFTFCLGGTGPKVVVMIGDAAAHSAPSGATLGIFSSAFGGDPGRDEVMFTSDDLDYVPVIQQVAFQGISVFTIDYAYSGDAYENFDYISTETGGLHYNGGTAWETVVASEIQTRLGISGDVVFIYDLSGSMSDDLSSVKVKTKAIVDALPVSSDFAFGTGTHVDYPNYYDSYGYADTYGSPPDYAWQMNLDLTTDRTLAKNTIDMLVPFYGGDGPQNYVRALYETMHFSWRFAGIHDVSVTDVKPLKTVVGQGCKTGVNVTAANEGGYAETFDVSLFAEPAGLVGCWKFDEGTGTTAYDSSGNSNHGILVNGPTWVDGKLGRALRFDGLDDYVDIGNWFDYQTFTIEMWVNPGAFQTGYANIIDNNHRYGINWVLQQNSTTTNRYYWGGLDGSSVGYFDLSPDQWTHVAITRDGNKKANTVYINGETFLSLNGTSDIHYDGNQFVRLARFGGGGRNWNGTMDEVRIYNRALSANEIWAEYASAPTLIETQTVTLESGASTTVTFTWNTNATGIPVPYGDYHIIAYAEPVDGETDTADNIRTYGTIHIGIPGDVNGDKKVSLNDVFAVARAFGSVYNSTDGWYWHTPRRSCCPHHPNCDINWDRKIDLRDYYITCRNFGKEEP